MLRATQLGLLYLAVMLSVAACGSPQTPQQAQPGGATLASERARAPKRITAAITGNPTIMRFSLIEGSRNGVQELEELVHAGLTHDDASGTRQPRLAEGTATVENGQWRVFPDGRMETTWTIKAGAQWHDGTPFSSADLVVTAAVSQDREVPARFSHVAFDAVDRVEAPDARTIVVHWKRPYIEADMMFTRELAPPLPKHLLEPTYLADKANLLESPYWNTDFVGTGPFKLQHYVRDSHVVLVANDQYILGRPRIDQLTVKFIGDTRALVANVLAGEVDLTMGRSISLDEALPAEAQWREGTLGINLASHILMHPQFQNARPAVIADVQFRRALLHAVDRQQMADVLQAGKVTVAHSFLNPQSPIYQQVQGSIVRHEYDARRAMQLIEALGYRRGSGGSYQDPTGEPLSLEIRAGEGIQINVSTMLAVAEYWRQIGVGSETLVVPRQQARDFEYAATRSGFEMTTTSSDMRFPPRLHSRQVPRLETRFQGSNNSNYMNPDFDALIDKYLVTIPMPERIEVIRGIVRHLTENLVAMGMFYDVRPALVGNRLVNVAVPGSESPSISWNAHLWDVKD